MRENYARSKKTLRVIQVLETSVTHQIRSKNFVWSFTLFADHIPPLPRSLSSLTSPLLPACSWWFCTWTFGSIGRGGRVSFFAKYVALVRVAISAVSLSSSSDPEFSSLFSMLYDALDATVNSYKCCVARACFETMRLIYNPFEQERQSHDLHDVFDSSLSLRIAFLWPRKTVPNRPLFEEVKSCICQGGS